MKWVGCRRSITHPKAREQSLSRRFAITDAISLRPPLSVSLPRRAPGLLRARRVRVGSEAEAGRGEFWASLEEVPRRSLFRASPQPASKGSGRTNSGPDPATFLFRRARTSGCFRCSKDGRRPLHSCGRALTSRPSDFIARAPRSPRRMPADEGRFTDPSRTARRPRSAAKGFAPPPGRKPPPRPPRP